MGNGLLPGRPFPLGATLTPEGVNFCLFSKNCTDVELLLFDDADDAVPSRILRFDRRANRTFYYWHGLLPDIAPGQLYGYRVYGPFAPVEGHRFDGQKVLLDPYARGVAVGRNYIRAAAARRGDNCAHAMKAVVVSPAAYDWEGDMPLGERDLRPVIYEMHVGGFTRHPSSGLAPELRGTYAGVSEKIPYLKSLGVTAVELLPVQQFDDQDAPTPLSNYWGYSPVAFFAPHRGYSARRDWLGPVDEFRDMVKALHRAGIEVIMDVVFNHTGEGGADGPTVSFRGIENRAYYILHGQRYANFSGCGNTFNTNQSIVRRLIMDCLHYWVAEMHVDGFRFDLAAVMSRGEHGELLRDPPILWEIESDPVLSSTKIIAEAWDLGVYQVGTFVGHRWQEWNARFRDDVRRFLKSDPDTVSALASRILGSPDLYDQPQRTVNFVTSHDGFTLNDLVSYNEKHNVANQEGNRDGSDYNLSWNCGVEGLSQDAEVEALRLQQIKNAFTLLLIAQGTPMLLMGDEVRRTQGGNNNAYCQDNALSWFDWNATRWHSGLLRFVRGLLRFTQGLRWFGRAHFWGAPELTWHGVELGKPDWSYDSHSLAWELYAPGEPDHLHVILNAYWEPLRFALPPLASGGVWRRVVDTALAAPKDFIFPEDAPPASGDAYLAAPRSVALLLEC